MIMIDNEDELILNLVHDEPYNEAEVYDGPRPETPIAKSVRLFEKYLNETPEAEILKLFDKVEKSAPNNGSLEVYFDEMGEQLGIQ